MNHYMMIRRLRGPAFLLLVGVLALLNQAHILSWGKSWPLYLILGGVLLLAERTALATGGGYPQSPYPGQPFPGPYQGPNVGSTQIVPSGATLEGAPQSQFAENSTAAQAYTQDSGKDHEGGQS
jgi:hypothetical protein